MRDSIISKMCSGEDQWDEFLESSVFAYNTSYHESTNYNPFKGMFGHQLTLLVILEMDTAEATSLSRYIATLIDKK